MIGFKMADTEPAPIDATVEAQNTENNKQVAGKGGNAELKTDAKDTSTAEMPGEEQKISSKRQTNSDRGYPEGNVFKTPTTMVGESKSTAKAENQITELESTSQNESDKSKNDGFLSPMSLPPTAKSIKKDDQKRSPVSMAFRSKFAIPADIYKAPKVAAFMVDRPPKPKAEKEEQKTTNSEQLSEAPSEEKPKPPKPPPAKFTYDAPDWGCEPASDKYFFEVLKMGAIVGKTELSEKEYFSVGRLADCDIKMEHPSISRYHAVVQHGAPGPDSDNVELQKDGSPGFYVYDLGSTHGTIINKTPIPPKIYFRIKVGHVVKFGGSTRMFILQGPPEDQEEESKESATELRQFNRQKIKKKKDLERMMLGEDSSSDDDDEKKTKTKENAGSSGVTWGMLEDAVQSSSDEEEEEEGDSLDMHPDAVKIQTKKDPFYYKDPMKALKNLYEREKMDLDFECNERRSGNWHIRLCLPFDGKNGKPVYAEVNATGKKKPAMVQCALEACRTLERHGMFHHADHHKQKAKQWEKDDFYDSDEDEFIDRTGELEKKRTQRMNRVGKSGKATKAVETYESLCKKVSGLDAEVKDIEARLQKDKEVTKVNADSLDPLDAFMQQVKSGKALDTTTRAKLKQRLFDAKKEHARLSKLADLARPSTLPPLANSFTKTYSFIGKMKGKKKAAVMVRPVMQPEVMEEGKEEDDIVEVDEDEEPVKKETKTRTVKLVDIEPKPKHSSPPPKSPEVVEPEKTELPTQHDEQRTEKLVVKTNETTTAEPEAYIKSEEETLKSAAVSQPVNNTHDELEKPKKRRTLGPTLPPELRQQLIAEQDATEQRDAPDGDAPEPKKKRKRIRKPKPQDTKRTKPNIEYSDDPNYSSWLPPEDQSGDGKISLNEKLGY